MTTMTKAKLHLAILAVSITAGLIACDPEDAPENFPHAPHIEMEIECDACHQITQEAITMPPLETCLMCHDIEEDEAYNRCSECHEQSGFELTNDMGERIVKHEQFERFVPEEWQDVEYNHSEYWEDFSDCKLCHEGIYEAEGSSIDNLPSMEVSMAVHDDKGFSNDCSVCHRELNEWTAPPSHDSSWDHTHGKFAEFGNKQDCLMCHQESTCQLCHSVEKPRSHTHLFRRKTHGVMASFDRSKCLVCHRNDQCTVCHQASAEPIPAAPYHTPEASCLTCHSPMAAAGPEPRPPQRLIRPMPHRMMMGVTAGKCLECHLF